MRSRPTTIWSSPTYVLPELVALSGSHFHNPIGLQLCFLRSKLNLFAVPTQLVLYSSKLKVIQLCGKESRVFEVWRVCSGSSEFLTSLLWSTRLKSFDE